MKNGTQAKPAGFIALGDSLSDTYAGKPYADGHRSWTDLLRAYRPAALNLRSLAVAGSTSGDLLAAGQHATAAARVRAGEANLVSVMVGGNDVVAALQQMRFDARAVVRNVRAAVAPLLAAGARVILANVPDVSTTPALRLAAAAFPALPGLARGMTAEVNAGLRELAEAERLALVDVERLHAQGRAPLRLCGVDVTPHLYVGDGFHPSTLGSALLANAVLEALSGWGVDVPRFGEAEVLAMAGLRPAA